MSDKPSVIRETDDEARKLARVLLRTAGCAALAVEIVISSTATDASRRPLHICFTVNLPMCELFRLNIES